MATNYSVTHQPPDPRDAIRAFEEQRHRAERQLAEAKTAAERRDAQFWIDNADRNIVRWQMIAERGAR